MKELDDRIRFIDRYLMAARSMDKPDLKYYRLHLLAAAERELDELIELFWRKRG